MDKVIFHIDCNNFYASVECLLNPSLKNYAIAVSGDPQKRTGIILAKNYLAKAFGVKTGEAIWEAKQKCPTLICVAPKFEKYQEFSEKCHKIFYQYTDLVEPFGIDECWLDVTGSLKLFNCTPKQLAQKIQQQIKHELGLSVSVGISWAKTLAKLGSDMKKPMGLTEINRKNHIEILKQTKISDMIMVGKHTTKKLNSININTLYDLYCLKPEFLQQKFGVIGIYLHNAVHGIDDDKLITPKDEDIKSVGNGATAVRDMTSLEEIQHFLHDLASKVSHRMRAHNFCANTIHLGIKYADFSYYAVQHKKPIYFSNEQDIFNFAYEIFIELAGPKFQPVRALRVSVSNLISRSDNQQVNIFTNQKNENLCSTIDKLKDKFGEDIISFAKDYKSF